MNDVLLWGSIHLFYMFPRLEEGGLATYRAALVQNQHLTVLAEVELNELYYVSSFLLRSIVSVVPSYVSWVGFIGFLHTWPDLFSLNQASAVLFALVFFVHLRFLLFFLVMWVLSTSANWLVEKTECFAPVCRSCPKWPVTCRVGVRLCFTYPAFMVRQSNGIWDSSQ